MSVLEANGAVRFAPINVSASGDTNIVAPVTGRKIRVLGMAIIASLPVGATFKSGTVGLTGPLQLSANSMVTTESPWGLFETESGKPLALSLSAAVQVSGWLSFQETP